MFWDFINLFFSKDCAICSESLNKNEEFICLKCGLTLSYTNYTDIENNPIEEKLTGRIKYKQATALLKFLKNGKSQKLLHQLKYKNKADLAVYLGKLLAIEMNKSTRFKNIDYLIPVPLHPKKFKLRGFNQAERICYGISEKLNIPILNNNLHRILNTETQTKKTKEERWLNTKDAFEIKNKKELEGKHVLLVDDVFTTGATIESCCTKLEKANNIEISLAFIAVATH